MALLQLLTHQYSRLTFATVPGGIIVATQGIAFKPCVRVQAQRSGITLAHLKENPLHAGSGKTLTAC
jgi:hypothetical protein